MTPDPSYRSSGPPVERPCRVCAQAPDFAFTMAFQPLIDLDRGHVHGYEALVRGADGAGAADVLGRLTPATLYRFDQDCRVKAIELAHALDLRGLLSINFLPNAVYEPMSCIQATLDVSAQLGWPHERISFEITETEWVRDRAHLQRIIDAYRETGFRTALDDFGAGFANLDLLISLHPDTLKLDRQLILGIDTSPRRQRLVAAVIAVARDLDIDLVAEGVETLDEARWLYRHGVRLHQGYYYARPAFEAAPAVAPELIRPVVA